MNRLRICEARPKHWRWLSPGGIFLPLKSPTPFTSPRFLRLCDITHNLYTEISALTITSLQYFPFPPIYLPISSFSLSYSSFSIIQQAARGKEICSTLWSILLWSSHVTWSYIVLLPDLESQHWLKIIDWEWVNEKTN